MPTQEKEEIISEISEMLRTSEGVIFTDYRGMTMVDVNDMRKMLRDVDTNFMVVKNTLFLRAASEHYTDPNLEANLNGPTAASFAQKDIVATAKKFVDFVAANRNAKISIKGALVGGRFFDAEQVTKLSKMPPRKQLIAELVGQMKAPITNFVGTLDSIDPLPKFVRTLDAIIPEFVNTLRAVADKRGAEA